MYIYDEEQECCACDAKPCWEIISPGECGVTISDLLIEYTGKYIKSVFQVRLSTNICHLFESVKGLHRQMLPLIVRLYRVYPNYWDIHI